MDSVTQSFVPDLMAQYLGEESDIQGLYSSLDSQIVEKLGEPSSESGSDIDWEAETWTVSLYQRSELFVSVVQSWYPQKSR
ncbi:hypothetical protein Ami103574_14800 [Aminipila butyrica]|uniref:Uncharacterized protein n=1 Tax=Aminipila butyrica TaxID=433296 RepID=A0A858BYF2_9FIRM|nr:hypothetical protein [Aminipila butyrica]QIB70482.1 hypothetical protein Ami103574_14800 [Aminipila butyrica]